MADNVAITAGVGTTIASDDVGGVQHQRVKLSLGADGAAADAASGGGVEAGSLRVTIASDSTGLLSVDDNGGSLTVDGTVAVSAISSALPAGTNAIGKLAANSGVDIGDVDVTSVTPGTGASSLGKAEDAAHSSGDVGVMVLAVRKDSAAALAGTDGDYIPLTTDENGLLRVTTAAGGPASSVGGDVAHDSADSGNPVKVGFKAMSANPTAVASADRVNGVADLVGRQLVRVGQPRDLVAHSYAQVVNTNETSVAPAGGVGVYHDLTHITMTNENATTSTLVTLRDGTGGNTVMLVHLAARGTYVASFPVPLKGQGNSPWTVQQSATVNLSVTVQYEKNVA